MRELTLAIPDDAHIKVRRMGSDGSGRLELNVDEVRVVMESAGIPWDAVTRKDIAVEGITPFSIWQGYTTDAIRVVVEGATPDGVAWHVHKALVTAILEDLDLTAPPTPAAEAFAEATALGLGDVVMRQDGDRVVVLEAPPIALASPALWLKASGDTAVVLGSRASFGTPMRGMGVVTYEVVEPAPGTAPLAAALDRIVIRRVDLAPAPEARP